MRVLFVDDEQRINIPVVRHLREVEGFDVEWVASPSKMKETLESDEDFDLIILDVMMPPDDSVDATRTNRGMRTGLVALDTIVAQTKRMIPVIIYTARRDLDEDDLEEHERVCRYLKKPTTPEELMTAIRYCAGTQTCGEGS